LQTFGRFSAVLKYEPPGVNLYDLVGGVSQMSKHSAGTKKKQKKGPETGKRSRRIHDEARINQSPTKGKTANIPSLSSAMKPGRLVASAFRFAGVDNAHQKRQKGSGTSGKTTILNQRPITADPSDSAAASKSRISMIGPRIQIIKGPGRLTGIHRHREL